ncbi:class I SAM-dependent methyltransferase [Maribacter sp. 2210JD10-5]|uniref:class I SAM-dependent methyltransferase n=1 Tax=Maribacter sp. 2210JD10-5 TaxID=3386272 RepID=UPI0039BD4F94
MEQIYEMKLWGGESAIPFYSGEGSHHPELVVPYLKMVIHFLQSFEKPLIVLDLGCGDFNVGKALVSHTRKYIAVDIVPDLIAYNKKTFNAENLEFRCLDIAKENWPKADCIILRQVLQHLSNAEIQQIVSKLGNYKYVLLTEHLPQGDFIPNKDIISGQGIRLKKQSGVDVLAAPFHLKVKSAKQLLTVPVTDGKGVIKTMLYKLF